MADQNKNDGEKENGADKAGTKTATARPAPWNEERLELEHQKLYRAAMDGNWETAKAIIDNDDSAKTKRISLSGFTALHVAASCGQSEFVVKFVKLLSKNDLEIKDQLGRTALHHVALAANVRAAKAMVEKNPQLSEIDDMNSHVPLLYAAQWRHPSKSKEMMEYLREVTDDEHLFKAFDSYSAFNLIMTVTASGSYDIALRILQRYPDLAYDKNEKGMSLLHVLAMQPTAFRSENKFSLWNLLTYKWMRKRSEIKRRRLDAVKLAEFVCKKLQKKSITFIQEFFNPDFEEEYFFEPNPEEEYAVLHSAIEHGVFEVVRICLEQFPDLIWYTNNKKRLLLHAAIEHRRVNIFNYIINFIGENTKAYAEFDADDDHNTTLHLAAKLAHSDRLQSVPGPAFQMQREVQWFKAVESLVYYESRTKKNMKNETPRKLFIESHKDLLKEAKEWMKDTSNSSMVVAALVATVAFAAMITVPGGNDSTGNPILSRKKLFIAFSVANALSMISSAISLLMFLSVQTSRYTEEDFLDSLPKILLYGLTFLFIAVATMMISFGTAVGLSLQQRIFNWAYIPITLVACCPAIIFYELQLPLILQMLVFTSGPGIFQGRRDWKFWSLNKNGYRQLANAVP